MHRWICTARTACAAFALALAPAWAANLRVALVIGNAAYDGAPLQNPVKDAASVARTLTAMGFQVVVLNDATKAQIEHGIADVRGALQGKQGVGLLYYAGHGMQLDWRNYLLPVDAKPASADDVRTQAVDVQQVLDAFRDAGNRLNIVVLDACRDNPFGASASGKGLAQMDAPPGTLLAYATAPGNVAEDGDDRGGLYTQHLVRELNDRDAKIEDVFKRVRFNVRRQSAGRQIPWESTSLEDDFFFHGDTREVPRMSEKQRAYEAERTNWLRIAGSDKVDDFYEHLKKYPSGSYSELASARVEKLQQAKVTIQPDQDGRREEELHWRPRDGESCEFVIRDGLTGLERFRGSLLVRVSGDQYRAIGTNIRDSAGTLSGFVVQDSRGTFDPPYPLVPNGMFQIGKKWSGRSVLTRADGSRTWVDFVTRVSARERIDSAVGTVDTYRVEMVFQPQDGPRELRTVWWEPGRTCPVKLRSETRRDRTTDIVVRELLSQGRTP